MQLINGRVQIIIQNMAGDQYMFLKPLRRRVETWTIKCDLELRAHWDGLKKVLSNMDLVMYIGDP